MEIQLLLNGGFQYIYSFIGTCIESNVPLLTRPGAFPWGWRDWNEYLTSYTHVVRMKYNNNNNNLRIPFSCVYDAV
jgi:hypothetical protein